MRARRLGGVALLTAALVLTTPFAAEAHVRVSPDTGTAGAEWTELRFAVPAEQTAATVAVEVRLDPSHPFLNLYVQPTPGWSSSVRKVTLTKPVQIDGKEVREAPAAVLWHADAGTELEQGQFQEFAFSVGPMPKVGSLRMTAVQILSDGNRITWADPIPRKGSMPAHPAPTLYVNDDPPQLTGGMAGMAGMGTPVSATAADAFGPSTVLPLALAAVALLLGAGGLVTGLIALRRSRVRTG